MQTQRDTRQGVRTARHYAFGTHVADRLLPLFPERRGYCDTIAATCRFELRGKLGNRSDGRKNWGLIVYANMQSYGATPVGVTVEPQRMGNFVCFTAIEATELILAQFDIGIDEFVAEYHPGDLTRNARFVDLMDVVAKLAPHLMPTEIAEIVTA